MIEGKRTLRVYHSNPERILTREEAITYLVTRELPERVILTGASPEQAERYQSAEPEAKRSMRMSYGHLTVAVGQFEGDSQSAEWQPMFAVVVTISPFDPEANVVTGGGGIATSIAGRARSVDESQALLRALAVATGIASSAEISVMVNNVVTL